MVLLYNNHTLWLKPNSSESNHYLMISTMPIAPHTPPARQPFTPRTLWMAVMVGILVLGSGLRFHRLETQSLWNDEGASYAMTLRAPADILTNTAADIHPPGYYLLLKGWTTLAGTSELALRMVSALASILTLASVYALGRSLFGRDAGAIAALLLAVNTFAIYYAQEARMYALLGLWATLSMLALVVWLQRADRAPGKIHLRPLVLLALVNAAGLYTQYAYPLTMVAQGLVFVLWLARKRQPRALAAYVAANLLTLLIFAPWAGEAIRQVTTWPNSGASTSPALLLSTVALGRTVGLAPWWAAFGALAFAAMGLWLNRTRPLLTLPAIWAAVTLGAFAALGLQPDDMKQLIPATSALTLWMGAGAASLWRDDCAAPRAVSIAATLAVGVLLVGSIPPLYTAPDFLRDDYRAIAATVQAQASAADAVILNGPGQGEVWSYYYDGPAPVYPLPRGLGGDDAATANEMTTILHEHRRIYALFWGERERDPNGIVETALDRDAFEVETTWVGRIRFVTYASPASAATTPNTTLDLSFSGQDGTTVTLEGYALDRASTYRAGDALTLTLFWRTDEALSTRYKVFVHLYADPDAPPPAQHDSEPGGGLAPTIAWTPGETVIDRHGLLIPPELPPGTYTLAVGIYAADDPTRRLTSAGGDRVEIGMLTVE